MGMMGIWEKGNFIEPQNKILEIVDLTKKVWEPLYERYIAFQTEFH